MTDGATDFTFHAYGRSEGVCGIIISDHAYPALVAHQLLSKIVDEFLEANPRSSWVTGKPTIAMPQLKEYIDKYQVSANIQQGAITYVDADDGARTRTKPTTS